MSLTLTRADGTTDIAFALQQSVGNQRIFVNPGSTIAEPETITIQSFLKPPGAKGSDRFLFKAQKTFQEDSTGNTIYVSAKLEITIPRSTESGLATAMSDQVAFLKCFTKASVLTALSAGVIPTDGTDLHVDTFVPA
jgi:hypothetical protein